MFGSTPTELIGSLGSVSLLVLGILVGCSIVSWAIILQKWLLFRRIVRRDTAFLSQVNALLVQRGWQGEDLEKLMAVARSHPESPSATICVEMVKRLPCDVEGIPASALAPPLTEGRWPNRRYLENVMHHLVQTQITRQERYLPFLATTGNIAPFIGLLGTVIGVINAFREIGIQGTASIVAVAPGVAEALVATAAGLFAAIPAVVAYNYFLMKIRQTTFRIEAFCLELLEALEGWMAQEQEKEVHVVR